MTLLLLLSPLLSSAAPQPRLVAMAQPSSAMQRRQRQYAAKPSNNVHVESGDVAEEAMDMCENIANDKDEQIDEIMNEAEQFADENKKAEERVDGKITSDSYIQKVVDEEAAGEQVKFTSSSSGCGERHGAGGRGRQRAFGGRGD